MNITRSDIIQYVCLFFGAIWLIKGGNINANANIFLAASFVILALKND